MAKQTIGIGTAANDGTGDPLRTAFSKAKGNFDELYARSFKGYKAGNWYIPQEITGYVNATVAANSIRLTPFFVKDTITIDKLGAIVETAESGKSIQFAIYASDANGKVTGNALATTGSISLTSTGAVNGAVNSGTPVQFTTGMYWYARNSDSAGTGKTVNISAASTATAGFGGVVGSATQANLLGSTGTTLTGFTVSQTFGTWPDLTASTPTEANNSSGGPAPIFSVSSVP